jgi:amino acid transporter
MKTFTGSLGALLQRLEHLVLGRKKSPLERGIFRRLSLIAFFAWVGLGADGLSSSCYGPEEAYRALAGHTHLAFFMAIATILTVAIIAASYSQIIQLFPSGGGGYVVATRLISPTAGVISGCALVVDYVLTIAVSVASGVEAILSFFSYADSPHKVPIAITFIGLLVLLNLRGLKESITFLLPIFLLFVVTHAILVIGLFTSHAGGLPAVVTSSVSETRDSVAHIGLWATLLLFLRAYTMGAGTYTGIEAVSNGVPVLREPRVETGKRTMRYMAISLALTASGILLGYRLLDIQHEPGRTMNATLLHAFADRWEWGAAFVALALLSEGALLFVAAQAGFVDGPRTLAFMAVDRWVPNRFANLSSRLVTANGILLMGGAAALALLYTKADVRHLVVMYSINVFVTFTLSQLGMVRHWWQERGVTRGWRRRLLLNGTGMLVSAGILIVTVCLKFFQGGWVTVLITGSVVMVAVLIRRHYRRFQFATTMLNLLVPDRTMGDSAPTVERTIAAVFVNRYDGLGLHTLGRLRAIVGRDLRKMVFLSIVQVDSDQFRDEKHLEELHRGRREDLTRYEALARSWGYEAESHTAFGTDVVEECEKLAVTVVETHPDALFIAGQVVFRPESFSHRILHNEVAFALQRRLIFRGFDMIILPVELPREVW